MQPHFPSPFDPPRECVRRLLNAVLDREPLPESEAFHCSWVLAGYALTQLAADRPLIGAREESAALAYLEHVAAGMAAGAVPWPVLIPLLVELLLRLLNRKETP